MLNIYESNEIYVNLYRKTGRKMSAPDFRVRKWARNVLRLYFAYINGEILIML